MPRQKSDQPYATGPEPHRLKWRIQVHRRSDIGNRETRIYSFETEAEAEKFKRAFAVVRATHGQTVGEAVNKYMAWCADKGNKVRTMHTARWRLGNILDLDALLAELRPAKAQRLYDTLRETALSIDSQRTSLVQAKAFGGWCAKTKLLPSNPFQAVEAKGRPARGKTQMRIDEGRALRTHRLANPGESSLIVLLAGWRGLRASEIVGLTARDIDDGGTLLWVADRDGKTAASRRRLRLPEWMQPAVAAQRAKVTHVEGWLFTSSGTRGHRQMSRHRALDMAQAVMFAAGVPVISLHGLRGLFSTLTATEGGMADLSRDMGHTSETMTLRHYIDRDALDDAKVGKL